MPTVIQLHGAYARARSQPVWALLASDDAAEALAIFYVNFTGAGLTQIPTGRFHERAGDDIRALNMSGATLNRTTSQYCSKWVSDNWLERNPNDAGDGEVYELTPDALMALNMVEQIVTPTTSTTKSQVSAIMTQLTELNVRTDTNQETKLAALYAQREALEREISRTLDGHQEPIDEELAVESVRAVLFQVRNSGADFARLRRHLSNAVDDLRRQAIESDGNRGDIIEMVLDRTDLTATEQGRSFAALYELLADYELLSQVESSINGILSRSFSLKLTPAEREDLRDMVGELRRRASDVHAVFDSLAAKLRTFVEERRYAEERLIDSTLKDVLKEFGKIAEKGSLRTRIPYELPLSSAILLPIGRRALHEMELTIPDRITDNSVPTTMTVQQLHSLADGADIDYPALRARVLSAFNDVHTVVTVKQIVEYGPLPQGLASLVGLILLAQRGPEDGLAATFSADEAELIPWSDTLNARIPKIIFYKTESDA